MSALSDHIFSVAAGAVGFLGTVFVTAAVGIGSQGKIIPATIAGAIGLASFYAVERAADFAAKKNITMKPKTAIIGGGLLFLTGSFGVVSYLDIEKTDGADTALSIEERGMTAPATP